MSNRVPIDAAEALASGCTTGAVRPAFRFLLYASALTLGGAIGGFSDGLIDLMFHPSTRNLGRPIEEMLEGLEWPLELLFSSAIPLILAGLVISLWIEHNLHWWWFGLVTLQTGSYLGANCRNENLLAWIPGILICVMIGAGVWSLSAWHRSRWARELALLQAEAASDIAEQEAAERDVTDESA